MHFERKLLLAFSLLVLLIRQSTAFTCSDGCDIFDSYVEDDYCDCVDCSDESSWDCTSCGSCPSQCGTWVYCSPLISSNISINTNDSIGFLCDDGCVVDESFENDDWCDCSNCEDETSTGWDCTNCQCPTECGTYYSCPGDDGSSLTTTGKPSGFTTTSYGSHAAPTMSTSNVYNFSCNDGCTVPYYWVNDDWCDCGECEDEYETGWTCSSCLCPTECGIYYHCDNSSSNGVYGNTRASDSDKYFFCDDGCKIDESWQNDHYCDCQNCEDETDWDCQSCGKCPHTCGDYIYCLSNNNDNDNSDSNEHYSTTTDGGSGDILSTYDTTYGNTYTSFTCDDGCVVDYSGVNDNWCHCSNCEDEYTTGWSCDNCTCPTECGDYYHCYLNSTGSGGENLITTRNGNGNENATFTCEDGCHIPVSYMNDNYCDCSECEDEESWDCDSCRCPTTRCDDFYLCDGEWTGTDSNDNVAPNNNIFDTSTSSGQIALAMAIIGIVVILIFIVFIAIKGIGRAKQKNSSRNNEMTMDAVVEAQRQSLKTHGALGGSSLGSPLDSPLGGPSSGTLSDTETGGENIYSNDDNDNNNNNNNNNGLNPQLEMNEIINVYKDTNGLSDGE